jgi:HAE1 family hydrophobic/amphiphilic exporter-1
MIVGAVRNYVAEDNATTIDMAGEDIDVTYKIDPGEVSSVDAVADAELQTPLGDTVLIKDVAAVEEVPTPVAVLTRNQSEFAAVTASVTDRDSNAVITAMDAEIAALDLPEGVDVQVAGMAEMMNEAFLQLGLAMLVAVAAVYLVMVIAFGEAIAPLAIMFSLPLAIIGSVVALLVMGIPLDMPAMIGLLMLIGIVTTNAIVLIDRVQQKIREGMQRREAILVAGADRIRPVLMTALTTICALLPLAAGLAEGALISQSLAVTVVGGLTTSTLLTLVVVPVIFDMLEGWKERILGEQHEERNAMTA